MRYVPTSMDGVKKLSQSKFKVISQVIVLAPDPSVKISGHYYISFKSSFFPAIRI